MQIPLYGDLLIDLNVRAREADLPSGTLAQTLAFSDGFP